jgi:long-chain acyl-CoA synthetase
VSDVLLQKLGKNRDELDLEAIRNKVNEHLPRYCQLSALEQRDTEFVKTPKKSIRRFLYK